MSRLPRAINSLLRPSQCSSKPSVLAPPRTLPVSVKFSTRHTESTSDDHPSSHTAPSVSDDDARFAAHLNSVFRSLEFPPELARRILTHGSHKAAIHGHNGRLGFIGEYLLCKGGFLLLALTFLYHTNIDRPSCLGVILFIIRPRSCTRSCTPRL